MKHSLQLRLSQSLTLTPQLQQSIRLLQLSTLELNQELEQMIQDNPLLERAEGDGEEAPEILPEAPTQSVDNDETYATSTSPMESAHNDADTAVVDAPQNEPPAERESDPEAAYDFSGDDVNDEFWGNDAPGGGQGDDDESDYPQQAAHELSLREHLMWQINLLNLSDQDKIIVSMLIDHLNDDGYLTMPLEELFLTMPPELEIEQIEFETALKHLQNLDPPGVGARDLAECLTLQLELMPRETPYREKALILVKKFLNLLAARDFGKLKKLLQCNDEEIRHVQRLITSLNPRPGGNFSGVDTRYIVHDVEVTKVAGKWTARLNPDAMPKLRINRMYADILRRNRDAPNKMLTGQLQEARWLIKNVQQRFDTILRVSQAIIERQRHFFEHGEVAMRPLVLREIAEAVGLHESTVSRVTTQKFMLSPRGIFELKYFFGSHVATETGGACSATAIRALIKQLVGSEDSKKPLSDSQITEVLAQQGIVVARRTIAKYRESLHIPPVAMRKSF